MTTTHDHHPWNDHQQAPTTTVTIGYTEPSSGYDPAVDGFRLGADFRIVQIEVPGTPSIAALEDALTGHRGPLAATVAAALAGQPPVQVGDTISAYGILVAREQVGWSSPAAYPDDDPDDDDTDTAKAS